jgi:hypothetical protein
MYLFVSFRAQRSADFTFSRHEQSASLSLSFRAQPRNLAIVCTMSSKGRFPFGALHFVSCLHYRPPRGPPVEMTTVHNLIVFGMIPGLCLSSFMPLDPGLVNLARDSGYLSGCAGPECLAGIQRSVSCRAIGRSQVARSPRFPWPRRSRIV